MKTIPHQYMGIQPAQVEYPILSDKISLTAKNNKIFQDLKTIIPLYYGINHNLIYSKSRKREYVTARQITIYFLRKYTTFSLSGIAKNIVDNHIYNHATIINANNTIKDLLSYDKSIQNDIKNIKAILDSYDTINLPFIRAYTKENIDLLKL